MNIGIIAFTDGGRDVQQRIISSLTETFSPYERSSGSAKDFVTSHFYSSDALIFIGAVGIAVRMISGLLVSKDSDPAVIVVDEKGHFVIPILSGHIGGANRLALQLAGAIDATPVITTATDINGVLSIDEWSSMNGCVIDDITKIKTISAAMLRKEQVGLYSDFPIKSSLPTELQSVSGGDVGVCISLDERLKPYDTTLNIIPKVVVIGIGCRKNTPFEQLKGFIANELSCHNISIKSVKAIASIELKKDEDCIVKLGENLGVPFVTFTAGQLNAVAGEFSGSAFVKATTGVDNVCERSAVLLSGGSLAVSKVTNNGMTLAVAMSDWWCIF